MKTRLKKAVEFSAYPILCLLTVAVNYALLSLSGIPFISLASIVLYIFAGGILLYKLKDEKIKALSLVITAVAFYAVGIYCGFNAGDDTAQWISFLVSPFSTVISERLDCSSIAALEYVIPKVLLFPLPVLISYLSSLVFRCGKKSLKTVLIIVLAFICMAVGASSIVSLINMLPYSYYEDGTLYNAFYDVNGVKYKNHDEVPYYDHDGNVYHYVDDSNNTDENGYSSDYNLSDQNGNIYSWERVYVYADGYIFVDKNEEVEFRDDLPDGVVTDWCYEDKNGNICSSVLCVSYTTDGEPYFGMGDEYKTR